MKVVAGLGNPGRRYAASRHNVGFWVVDRVAARLGLQGWRSQFQAAVLRGQAGTGSVFLVKPQTYMNRSGLAVAPLMRYHHIGREALLVVVDDLDLPLGRIRARTAGSTGGHKGLASLIAELGGQDFKRIRIGIGRPPGGGTVVGHVLGRMSSGERQRLDEAVEVAADLAIRFLDTGEFENWTSP